MPTFIKERKRTPWKAQIRRQGYGTEVAYFNNEDDAIEWEQARARILKRKLLGMKPDVADLKHITVEQLVNTYLKKNTSNKAAKRGEIYFLKSFLEYKDFSKRSLLSIQGADAVEFKQYLEDEYQFTGKAYIHKKSGKTITPNYIPKSIKAATINRKLSALRNMWTAAKDWRGYEGLTGLDDPNPWINLSSSTPPKKRTRRLNDHPSRENELNRLIAACDGCYGKNKLYMRLLIHMAVQLGMRLQEILFLQSTDIDFNRNRLTLYKSKTNYKSDADGREIVFTTAAKLYLTRAVERLGGVEKTERIIPMSTNAFTKSWIDLCKRAGINTKEEDAKLRIPEDKRGLEFRDLRREARSRFNDAGLTNEEHELMLGHYTPHIRGIYIAPFLHKIEPKLNDYWKTATDYHDADLLNLIKDLKKSRFNLEAHKQRIREEDERANQRAAYWNDAQHPERQIEIQQKLDALSKRQD